MPDFVDPSLRELRARLVAEYTDGRRQRLFGHLASCFEHCLVIHLHLTGCPSFYQRSRCYMP